MTAPIKPTPEVTKACMWCRRIVGHEPDCVERTTAEGQPCFDSEHQQRRDQRRAEPS